MYCNLHSMYISKNKYFQYIHSYFKIGLAMLDGYVYAVGGWEGSSRLDSVERYDPDTNVWTPVASLKMAVTSPAVVPHEGNWHFDLHIIRETK